MQDLLLHCVVVLWLKVDEVKSELDGLIGSLVRMGSSIPTPANTGGSLGLTAHVLSDWPVWAVANAPDSIWCDPIFSEKVVNSFFFCDHFNIEVSPLWGFSLDIFVN